MGNDGGDEVMVSGSGNTMCTETTVEIKIKTLDSETYTMRVNKCVPVPALKEQIATVTGVLSEHQRLICRGKVLKDDQLLSAYHVEDGHTLHLVVRQPIHPSIDGSAEHLENDPASSSGHRVNQSGPGVVVGTFNITEPGDGGLPDLGRIVSAVLGSFGVTNIGSGSEGADLTDAASEGIFRTARVGLRNPGGGRTDQIAASGSSYPGTGDASFSASAPLDPLQIPVIPDSLTTLTQYLSRMRNEFSASVRGPGNSSQPGDGLVSERQDSDAGSRSTSGGFPTPASLAEVILSTRQLLMQQSADSLSQLASQLEDQANVTDPLARMTTQSNALRTGLLLQHLGALLLELGRTTMTLRMGQTPTESVVNAGPAVFISTSGPNPIMVQPLHFQPGASFGAIPMGTGQHGAGSSGGSVGSGFLPRNIDIRIRTGPSMPSSTPTASQGEVTDVQQPLRQSNQSTPDIGSSVHVDASAASGIPRESEIRVIPIRTVVAALPASVRLPSSDASRVPVGSFYPVVARVQRLSSGSLGSQRGSQSSGQQPNSNHTVPQEDTRLPGGNANVPAGDGAQNSQDYPTGTPSPIEQLIRSIFNGEYASDIDMQGMGTGSATSDSGTNQGSTAVNAPSTQESTPAMGDGVFLSNLLHQIMPMISDNTAGGSAAGEEDTGNRDTQTSSTPGQEDTDRGTRPRRGGNPPSSPSSKRQRR